MRCATQRIPNVLRKRDDLSYREAVLGATHVLVDWHGRGPGRRIVGTGSLAVIEERLDSTCVLAGAIDAEARPAKATNRAKKRMATFIFGNLVDGIQIGEYSPVGSSFYRKAQK